MTNHRCMAIRLKSKPKHPNGSGQKTQDREKHVKFDQIWKLYALFSSIAKAWCIIDFCHKVVWSIRNNTLKICVDCAKQFVKNAQDCGKANHGFFPFIILTVPANTIRCCLLAIIFSLKIWDTRSYPIKTKYAKNISSAISSRQISGKSSESK